MNRHLSARACAAAVLGALVATSSVTAFEYKKFPGGSGSGTGGTLSRCGDNFVTGGEECEPPNTSVCSSTCTIIEPDGPGDCPACPDPADPDCPACPPPGPDCPPPGPDCPPVPEPGCGNDIIEGDEECEPPSEGFCTPDCKIVIPGPDPTPPDSPAPDCGDLIVQPEAGEECEPPSEGFCTSDCKIVIPGPDPTPPDTPAPSCGDLIVQAGEQCEPPSEGGCDANCRFAPPPPPPDVPTPTEPECGDLIVQPDAGEECEPPGTGDCGPDCKVIVPPPAPECGDLTVQEPEVCEPPGVGNCDENCQITETPPPDPVEPACGDGIIQPPEDCEPPNVGSCGPDCRLIPDPFCGDGIVQPPEECDPPGEGDCQADCTIRTIVPRTPPPGCVTCEDKAGKPSQVTLTWACQGPPPASVTGGGKKGGAAQYDPATGVAVFGSGGDSLGSQIDFEYDGVENSIHTSCSSEFGPGLRTFTSSQDKKCQNDCTCSGCFVVTDAVPEGGGEYCPFCNIEFLEQAAAGLPIGR